MTGAQAQANKEGRTGDSPNFFHTDSSSEAEARERGEESKNDAEETREENEKAEEKKDDE